MAIYSLGSLNIKPLSPEFNTPAGLPVVRLLNISRSSFRRSCSLQLDTKSPTKDALDTKPAVLNTHLAPNSSEIEALLAEICSTNNIAEFELKLSGFHLSVQRKLPVVEVTLPPPSPPIQAVSASNGSASTSLALVDSSSTAFTESSNEAPEGLHIVTSPSVGVFRTSFTIKGKRLPPCCTENQIVKSGTIVGCVELLNGRSKLKTGVTGEVIKFFCKDGEPVGYGDPLIAILPSFPGIKNLLPTGRD